MQDMETTQETARVPFYGYSTERQDDLKTVVKCAVKLKNCRMLEEAFYEMILCENIFLQRDYKTGHPCFVVVSWDEEDARHEREFIESLGFSTNGIDGSKYYYIEDLFKFWGRY